MTAASLVVLGCQRAEEITSYSVPKDAAPHATVNAAEEPTDRMLAAILPTGQQAWFWKVVGPMDAVDAQADNVVEFFASIRWDEGQSQPSWQLPAGWTEQKGTGMRAATIAIPADGEPLELSVTPLPWPGGPSAMLGNVNRWRGQLQLADVDQAGLANCTRESQVGELTLTVVDLRGVWKGSGMSGAPFAGGGPPSSGGMPETDPFHGIAPPGEDASAGAAAEMPAGHPPIGGAGPSAPVPLPEFTAPDGWEEMPAGGIRRAEFRITDGDQEAGVRVIRFPLSGGPAIADPLPNINLWRSEVGLAPVTADELADVAETIEIDGEQATYVAVLPDPSDEQQASLDRGTVVAMVTHDDSVWFFKLSGARDVVAAQRDAFDGFLESVRFADNDGASDGN